MSTLLTYAHIMDAFNRGQNVRVFQHSAPNGSDLLTQNFVIYGTIRAWKGNRDKPAKVFTNMSDWVDSYKLTRVYVEWDDGISNWIEPQHLQVEE